MTPFWHSSRWDWQRTAVSLGLCQRYAGLTPAQQLVHDAEAIRASRKLRQLMPAATQARIADAAFCELAELVGYE